MDVPLALDDIKVRYGLKGYIRKSSTFCYQAGVVGLSAFPIVWNTKFLYSSIPELL